MISSLMSPGDVLLNNETGEVCLFLMKKIETYWFSSSEAFEIFYPEDGKSYIYYERDLYKFQKVSPPANNHKSE